VWRLCVATQRLHHKAHPAGILGDTPGGKLGSALGGKLGSALAALSSAQGGNPRGDGGGVAARGALGHFGIVCGRFNSEHVEPTARELAIEIALATSNIDDACTGSRRSYRHHHWSEAGDLVLLFARHASDPWWAPAAAREGSQAPAARTVATAVGSVVFIENAAQSVAEGSRWESGRGGLASAELGEVARLGEKLRE
jgi:hypothetical protein|tara:strand:- start:2117 stop:2710 length:594 start_codon:yes stop_codon:yes gene_type:complete